MYVEELKKENIDLKNPAVVYRKSA
jgi:hypothetical protein